jgi:parvulin-like peptidyl-prolyl isomerase
MRDDETRNAVYTVFKVLPTKEDSMLIREKLGAVKEEFMTTDDDSMFVVNAGVVWQPDYLKYENLTYFSRDTVWSLEEGEIYGPYLDIHDGTYKITKMLGRRVQPDSAHVRHILIGLERQEQVPAALARADSVEQLLEDGVPFDSLALRYSNDDGSKVNGGDLGWIAEARFVKPFNDMVFHDDLEAGTIKRVFTEFGIHIIEVMEYKYETNEEAARIATLAEPIIPSEATQDYLYDDVLEFAGQNRTVEQLREAVNANDALTLEEIPAIHRNGYAVGDLGANETSRSIIRWMFDGDTDPSQVAPEIYVFQHPERYFNEQYVVAGLAGINKPGLPTPDQVMEQIEDPVANKKKAEAIAERVAGQDMNTIMSSNDMAEMDTVRNVNFGTQMLGNIGNEPDVIGTAANMQVGQVSDPIIGRNAVYVIELLKYTPASAAQNLPRLRDQGSFQIASAAKRELLPALKEKAEIEDNRFTYY